MRQQCGRERERNEWFTTKCFHREENQGGGHAHGTAKKGHDDLDTE